MSMTFTSTNEQFKSAIESSKTWSEVAQKLNLTVWGGGTRDRWRIRAKKLGISYSHFLGIRHCKGKRGPLWVPVEHFLRKRKSKGIGSFRLKLRLFQEGLKQNKCEICGLDEWLGKPLCCQLHHKSGDVFDNRLENLQILCPNCHTQTDTYAAKNRGAGTRKSS